MDDSPKMRPPMEVIQEPGDDPSPVQEHGNLLVLALLAFAVGGLPGVVTVLDIVKRTYATQLLDRRRSLTKAGPIAVLQLPRAEPR